MNKNTAICILFATSILEERLRFLDLIQFKKLDYRLLFPQDLKEADSILEAEDVDIIVTDLSFSGGAFADWLVLWPRPFILLSYYGEEQRLDSLIRDEACSFLMRDSDNRHLGVLPTMIRKVLNVRESLNRQNAHMQISERRYLDLVSSIPDIVYTLNGDGCFIYVNDSVAQLGYRPDELIGQHFSFIVDPSDVPRVSRELVLKDYEGMETGDAAAPKLFNERRSGSRMTKNLDVRLRSKKAIDEDDSSIGIVHAYGEVSCVGYSLPEYEGGQIGTVGIIRDVTRRRESELKLLEDLHIKDVLIKEIHHRVKNNLQVVSSLLNLQSSGLHNPESRQVFIACQNQIQSIAMVHEQLYRSDNLQSINLEAFLNSLITYLVRVFSLSRERITVSLKSEPVMLGLDQAIPLALIVNEMFSNAITHGFGSEGVGSIKLALRSEPPDRLILTFSDTGSGLPLDFLEKSSGSMGFQLIQALSSQLGGELSWRNDAGASFQLSFSRQDMSVGKLL